MPAAKSTKNCNTRDCPGQKVDQEMSGVKQLVEKVLVDIASLTLSHASLTQILAGTMERPGLVHQVRELSDSQRATAHAVEKLTDAVRELEQFKKSQLDANAYLRAGVQGAVKKDEVEKGARVIQWAWTIGGAVIGAVTGAIGLWAAFKKP